MDGTLHVPPNGQTATKKNRLEERIWKMSSLKNGLVALCIFMVISGVGYAQSFNNVPVDVGSGDQSETSIALDPDKPDTLMATWNDYSNGQYPQPGYAFSIDGGKSWINAGILKSGLNPSNGDYFGGFDPSCAIANSGREYYAFVNQYNNLSLTAGGVDIEYTTDNGADWSGPYPVSSNRTDEDKPYLAIDNSSDSTQGRVYVAWADISAPSNAPTVYSIYVAYPTNLSDLGGTWITKEIGSTDSLEEGPVPAVGPNGTVYVAYLKNSSQSAGVATGQLYVAMSTNSGNNFTVEPVGPAFDSYFNESTIGHLRVSSFPTVAVDPKNSEVYMAWTEDVGGSMDVYFMHTTASREITNWTTPQIATQSTTGNQFFPWLTFNSAGPAGQISLVYYQENSNNDVDVYSAQSYDGQSFVGQDGTGEDVKVTSVSSNPSVGATGYPSDYIGVTSDNSCEVHALWTDFRSGSNQDIYCANFNQRPTVALTPNYIDAGSGAFFLINGSQGSSIQVDVGTSITIQAVPPSGNWAFAG